MVTHIWLQDSLLFSLKAFMNNVRASEKVWTATSLIVDQYVEGTGRHEDLLLSYIVL